MPTVSLVLGAGGARGYAHIGVIAELEARGYQIVSVCGSSMGALIGGVYAAGGLQAYRNWVELLSWVDVVRLLDIGFGRGTIKGGKVFSKLRELIGDPSIESLPMPYTAIATDITNNKEVWFQRGNLLAAMRASIAVPGVFTPVVDHGRVLVDGGVLNPLPIMPTVAERADLILAVDLNSHGDTLPRNLLPEHVKVAAASREADNGRLRIMLGSMEVMQSALTRYKIAGYAPDLLIEIPKAVCGFHEFHRAREVIEIGRRLALYQLAAFEDSRNGRESGSVDE